MGLLSNLPVRGFTVLLWSLVASLVVGNGGRAVAIGGKDIYPLNYVVTRREIQSSQH